MAVKHDGELIVWQKAMDPFALGFPKEEMFGLTCQMRRAVVSVPSNIAEGQGQRTTREFLQFLSIARRSLQEAETQILVAERLGYLAGEKQAEAINLSSEVGRMISCLMNSLEHRKLNSRTTSP